MTVLEDRINGSVEFAGLPTSPERPVVLQQMDSPTAFTPTLCTPGLLVNLAYIQLVCQAVQHVVTSRLQAM